MMDYVYKCPNCGLVFTIREEINKQHQFANCPECPTTALRVWGDVAVQFKGEGFTLSADAKEENEVWDAKGG
jgi:putative FmdB family regulatory protein